MSPNKAELQRTLRLNAIGAALCFAGATFGLGLNVAFFIAGRLA